MKKPLFLIFGLLFLSLGVALYFVIRKLDVLEARAISFEARADSIRVARLNPILRQCGDRGDSLINVRDIQPNILVDLKYSSTDNFIGQDFYGDFEDCLLRAAIACKLANAQDILTSMKPGYRLICYDCLRPRSAQIRMWSRVKNTPLQKYVANPYTASIHNFGAAVDISLVDNHGNPVDMGTPFDDFTSRAHPRREQRNLEAGLLTAGQVANRLLLRKVMVEAGFRWIGIEWWHFNGDSKKNIRKLYRVVE